MFYICALGTSATFPTETRNHPAIYLEYKGIGMLFDCGENTQKQMRLKKISPNKIKYIFLTHWHGDHCLGIPGVLFYMANSEYKNKLTIYVPKGYKNNIENIIKDFEIPKINLEIIELPPTFKSKVILDLKDFYIEYISGEHSIPVVSYRFKEKDYWKLDNNLLKKYGIFKSPKLKYLKKYGKINHNNQEIKIEDVGYIKRGISFTYITDTILLDRLYNFAENSDILIAEATYLKPEDKVEDYYHMSLDETITLFKNSNSKLLFITHISQRYEDKIDIFEKEILNKYSNVYILRDFDEIRYFKKKIILNLKNIKKEYLRLDNGTVI